MCAIKMSRSLGVLHKNIIIQLCRELSLNSNRFCSIRDFKNQTIL